MPLTSDEEELLSRLEYMARHVEVIRAYTRGGREVYERHLLIVDAVAMRLVMIGETVKALTNRFRSFRYLHSEVQWSELWAIRDELAHQGEEAIWGYSKWDAIEGIFPALEAALRDEIAALKARKSEEDESGAA